jgi:hypothetical protein
MTSKGAQNITYDSISVYINNIITIKASNLLYAEDEMTVA